MPRSIYTVSDLTQSIKDMLEGEFADVWVEGEISNLKAAASGHIYFTLKDAASQLRAVVFRNSLRFARVKPADGLRVVARGRLTIYEQRGEYQIVVDHMEPAGYGALQLAFEHLKDRLGKEGLFEPSRKREIPKLPKRIGLITSPSGAAIADIISVVQRRFENLHLVLYPVRVQGEEASEEIAAALKYFSLPDARQVRGEPDVVILARGGGSLEDLWAFNTEVVARAIVASRIPVISAVGHETDFTIADFVADCRAPTPSAAAEMVIESKEQLDRQVETLRGSLQRAIAYRVQSLWRHSDGLERRLSRLDIRMRLRESYEQSAELARRLEQALLAQLQSFKHRLAVSTAQLQSLDPQAVLDRGYALVTGPDGSLVRDAAETRPGDDLTIRVSKGVFGASVSDGRAGPKPR